MSVQEALELSGNKPRGKRPWFLENQDAERVLAITMSIAGEVSVLRQRLDTIERLLDDKGTINRADIEAFTPDQEAAAERGLWNQEYIARIMRVVQQEREALDDMNEPSSESLGEEIEKDR